MMTARSVLSPLSYVYDGRHCLGLILKRGKLGFEAIDRDEQSLGLLPSQRAAAAVIFKKMPGHEGPGNLKDVLHDACSNAKAAAQEL
jgi:hypothetical protein